MNKRKHPKRRRKHLGFIKLILTIIFIILLIYLFKLGANTMFKKDDTNTKNDNNEQEVVNKKEEDKEEEKYTKEEKEQLEKLDYVNEKIDYFKWENIDRYIKYKEKNPTIDNKKIVLYVNIGIDNNFYTNTDTSPDQHTNTVLVNKYYYVGEKYVPKNLVSIDSKYQSGGKKLTREAVEAFNKMASAAKEEGYTIRAVSTYRSYSYQNTLYNNYANRDGYENADTYSARPGYSEHQTGLAVDVDNAKISYTSFGQTKEFAWMKENAHKYGYILRYTKENEFITGYMNEPWHYRYVGVEIATKMKNENISSYEEYYFMYLDK
ncbi:MAG: D-alanyl-D-alanine carboxypeptidase family protein [Firmicutes bacterium]|nr:D-alanyl-D-alanine carboxypeptidase family protein [Bacillota bacterium]